jgi:hypothetical protein
MDWLLAIALLLACHAFMPEAVDVEGHFQPVARALLAGQSPYTVKGFYNPAWAAFPLVPLAWLPTNVASFIIRGANLLGFVAVARYMGCSPVGRIAVLLSPPVIFSLVTGGFGGVVLLGLTMTPWLGALFLAVKPQLTIGSLILGVKRGYRIYPLLLAIALSLAFYGVPSLSVRGLQASPWSLSLWPWGVLVGIPLLCWGLVRDDDDLALMASPFLSPYTSGSGYSGMILVLAKMYPSVLLWIDGILLVWGIGVLL